MKRASVLALALALAATLVGGCDKKDAASKPAPTAPAPTTTPPKTPPPAPPAEAPAPGASAAAAGLKLPMATRTVGTRWVKTDDVTSTMVISVTADKQLTVDSTQHKVDEIEVVELDAAGLVTKVKVSYPERKTTDRQGTQTKDKISPLAGKSYLAWSKGGALEATHADGSAVTPEELEDLTDSLDELGKPRVMDEIVSARTWKIGETYTFTADDIARLVAAKTGKTRPAALALTLREVKDGKATFAMTAAMVVSGKAQLSTELSGSVTIDVATGHPVTISLAGPAKGSVNGMSVAGTMSGTTSYAYPTP